MFVRRTAPVLTLVLLLSALAPLGLPAGGLVVSDLPDTTLTFMTAGSDLSMVEDAPKESTVLIASVRVSGQEINPGGQPDVYDYSDQLAGHEAWTGDTSDADNKALNLVQQVLVADTTPLSIDDDVEITSAGTSDVYHHFQLVTDIDEMAGLDVSWNGKRNGAGDVGLFLFDHQLAIWTELDADTPASMVDFTLDGTITDNFANYFDGQAAVDVLVISFDEADADRNGAPPAAQPIDDDGVDICKIGDPNCGGNPGGTLRDLFSDYVSFSINRGPGGNPGGISLDLSDDGSNEWNHGGLLNAPVVVDLQAALQARIDAAGPAFFPGETTNIVWAWEVTTPGRLVIDQIDIQYQDEKEPVWDDPMPGSLTIEEDGPATAIVDLSAVLDDADTDLDELTVTVTDVSPEGAVDLVVAGGRVHGTPSADWNGVVTFTLTADDGVYTVVSAPLTLSVTPVNDAPTLLDVPDQTVNQGEELQVTVIADDADLPFDELEVLTFSTDGVGTIDPLSGLLSWTPGPTHVGVQTLTVSVADTIGEEDETSVQVTVVNTNDGPELPTLGPWQGKEDVHFKQTVTAADLDLLVSPTETLTYTDDSELFEIDPLTGVVSFTPVQSDVGSHEATITVTDGGDLSDSATVTLDIINTNDKPTIAGPATAEVISGEQLKLTFEGADQDIGYDPAETLSFATSLEGATLTKEGVDTAVLLWTPSADDVGVVEVQVSVKDRVGVSAFHSLTVTVVEANVPPTVELRPADAAKELPQGVPWEATVLINDENGDDIEVCWKVDGVVLEGQTDAKISLTLPPGQHTVTACASDGELDSETTYTFTVLPTEEPKKGDGGKDGKGKTTPGFEGVLVALALLAALGIARRRRSA